jgi:hypothetical protein
MALIDRSTRLRFELVLDCASVTLNAMQERTFNTDEPIAYFITWTTYGTWLPGDERGWCHKGDGQLQAPNELLQEIALADMKEPALELAPEQRSVVESTVARHCEIRSWTKYAINARSNHVHVVVSAPGYTPEIVRDQFKAWCTRLLKPTHSGRTRFWTEGASCRWINHEDDLEGAIIYVQDAQ